MAKVNIKNVKQITDKIERSLKDVLLKDETYVEISNFVVERIRQKARLSKRMEQDGSDSKPTASLSKGYVEKRKKIKRGQDGTDPEFFLPEVKNSQLTFSGQLLKSLAGKIKKKGETRGTVEVEFTGVRKDGQANKKIYNSLLNRSADYNILALSKKSIELIRNKVLTRLRQALIKNKLK